MKLVLISDTHGKHGSLSNRRLPAGDLLIHAGDFSGQGYKAEVEDFVEWMDKQSSRYTHGVIFIAGNHDRSFDPKYGKEYENFNLQDGPSSSGKPAWLCDILHTFEHSSSRITYLENKQVTVQGIKVWGSPTTPWFHGDYWAFNKQRGLDIKEVWDQIPPDTDIVVTHGPVMGKLDYVPSNGVFVGCEELENRIKNIKPILHVCGHIHEGYGKRVDESTMYVNASICNHHYDPINKPIVVEINTADKSIKY